MSLSDDGAVVVAAGPDVVKRFSVGNSQRKGIVALRSDLIVLTAGTIGANVVVAKTAEKDRQSDVVLAIPAAAISGTSRSIRPPDARIRKRLRTTLLRAAFDWRVMPRGCSTSRAGEPHQLRSST